MSKIINRWDLTPPTQSFFATYGHQGKWKGSITVSGGETLDCTGSNGGVGAVIIANSDTTIHLSGGGTVPGSALTTNTIHELAPSKIVNGGSGVVYALIKNHLIR